MALLSRLGEFNHCWFSRIGGSNQIGRLNGKLIYGLVAPGSLETIFFPVLRYCYHG